MAQILVRGLDEETVRKLKERAKREGRSLQAEVKRIITQSVDDPPFDKESWLKRIMELRRRFKGRKLDDSLEIIREARESRER